MTEALSDQQRSRVIDLVGESLFVQDCDALTKAYADFRRGMTGLAARHVPAAESQVQERPE